MNLAAVQKIASTVLYEGYVLYPYCASALKNQQRFNFGVLYPQGGVPQRIGDGVNRMRTECLVQGHAETRLEIRVRCLQLRLREIAVAKPPFATTDDEVGSPLGEFYQTQESIEIDGQHFSTWQEAEEREFVVDSLRLQQRSTQPQRCEFVWPGGTSREPLANRAGQVVAQVIRTQHALHGTIEISSWALGDDMFKIRVDIINQTVSSDAQHAGNCVERDAALLHSMISTHTVLGVCNGQFVSLLETPEEFRHHAADCQNVGTWPVLVGEPGDCDLLLSSPIILYDYPQIAPESPGDLFDGTENDELLTLSIMSLTDVEKNQMRGLDSRARQLLERTESLPPEQLARLHGAIRGLKQVLETNG